MQHHRKLHQTPGRTACNAAPGHPRRLQADQLFHVSPRGLCCVPVRAGGRCLYGAYTCGVCHFAENYVRVGQLSNVCPPDYAKIYDVPNCQAAHQRYANFVKDVILRPAADIPSGCFYTAWNDKLYLNMEQPGAPMKQGATDQDAILLCAGALGPKPHILVGIKAAHAPTRAPVALPRRGLRTRQ